jgi:protein-S-isoprenylcysteine O-methyltransferase Ste14
MLGLMFTNTAYSTVFWIAFAIWLVPEFVGGLVQRSVGRSASQDRGSAAAILISIMAAMVIGLSLGERLTSLTIGWHPGVVFAAGIALMLAGVVFRWYAIRELGPFFTRRVAIQPGQRVVESGPYRLIRHPSYSGALLTLLGVGLAMTNWASLAVVIVLSFAGYSYRARVEERALTLAFGQTYVDYMKRTKRFIPFVL